MVAVAQAEGVLRDELPAGEAESSLARLRQWGVGGWFEQGVLVDVDPATGAYANARPRYAMAGAGSDRRADDLLSVS